MMSDQIQMEASTRESLGSKMKRLYQRTSEGMNDEESKMSYANLFNQVMAENEEHDELPEEQASHK